VRAATLLARAVVDVDASTSGGSGSSGRRAAVVEQSSLSTSGRQRWRAETAWATGPLGWLSRNSKARIDGSTWSAGPRQRASTDRRIDLLCCRLVDRLSAGLAIDRPRICLTPQAVGYWREGRLVCMWKASVRGKSRLLENDGRGAGDRRRGVGVGWHRRNGRGPTLCRALNFSVACVAKN
jgi:hypothetical protein